MKAIGGLGNDGVVWLPTIESSSGERYETLSPFRAYKSLTDSMLDHDLLLRTRRATPRPCRWPTIHASSSRMLVQGGYATDPAYADKLIALMDRYDLPSARRLRDARALWDWRRATTVRRRRCRMGRRRGRSRR